MTPPVPDTNHHSLNFSPLLPLDWTSVTAAVTPRQWVTDEADSAQSPSVPLKASRWRQFFGGRNANVAAVDGSEG